MRSCFKKTKKIRTRFDKNCKKHMDHRVREVGLGKNLEQWSIHQKKEIGAHIAMRLCQKFPWQTVFKNIYRIFHDSPYILRWTQYITRTWQVPLTPYSNGRNRQCLGYLSYPKRQRYKNGVQDITHRPISDNPPPTESLHEVKKQTSNNDTDAQLHLGFDLCRRI